MNAILVVQNNVGNRCSPTTIVAVITSKKEETEIPTHVCIEADGLCENSAVAFMIQNYVIVAIADYSGWKSVMYVWIVLLVAATVFLGIAIPLWTRFKNPNKI